MEQVQEIEKVLVSACLLGVRCRWHGRCAYSKKAARLIEEWRAQAVLVCPEMDGGLPCPRPPVKRKKGRIFETSPEKDLRPTVTGPERTEEFRRGAECALALCRSLGIKRAILAARSPSCDLHGVTGKLLSSHGIEVVNVF